jgi:lysophospholipase L1-like esterase
MTPGYVFDIAFHGTGLTENVGGHWWQSAFASRLLAENNKSVRPYDFGSSGATAAAIRTDAGPGKRLRPWAAVFEAGANDCIQSVPVATYSANLAGLINDYKAASPGTRLFLMTTNPFVSPPVSAPLKAALPAYYQAMRDLAAATPGVTLIDVYPDWGSPNTGQIPDGIHPALAALKTVLIPKLLTTFAPLMAEGGPDVSVSRPDCRSEEPNTGSRRKLRKATRPPPHE